MSSAGRDALVAMLSRLKNDLVTLNLNKPDVARAALQVKYPLNGDYLVEVFRLCQRGISEGWLCEAAANGQSTARVTAPTKYFPFAVDAVRLGGSSAGHRHPKGEVALCWPLDGKPRFCGSEPGWAVFPPGSRHAPAVSGGTMFMLHFYPDGALEPDLRARTADRPGNGKGNGSGRARKPAPRAASGTASARASHAAAPRSSRKVL